MKILELSLLAFGPFTGVTLDLSAGAEGLHVVYGPNEAGKSSSLRALQQALFGIPVRSTDNFLHAHAAMRIGMTLRGSSGEELRFIRRKGSRATLLAEDGETPLPDDAVSRLLKGLGEGEFQGRFALGHDELVQGGKAILGGGGDLGTLLFQAGGGLKDLMGVQRELAREVEDLFKPSGQKPRINGSLAAIREAEEARKAHSLRSSEWVENERQLAEAEARLADIEARLADDRAARRRLERLREALPILSRQRAAAEEIEGLGDVPALREPFATERAEAQRGLEAAGLAIDRARAEIVALEGRAEGLAVPAERLAEVGAVDRLREAMGAARKARADLPNEEARLRLAVREAIDRLDESWPGLLGDRPRGDEPGLDPDTLRAASERLRLNRSQKAAIQRLATERTRLDASRKQAVALLADLAARHEAERAEIDRLPPSADTSALELALKRARDQGDLDGAIEAARAKLAQAERQVARGLQALPLWTGPIEALDALRVPGKETIQQADVELGRIDQDRKEVQRDQRKAKDEKVEAESAVERLRRALGDVPAEDDLRRDRDARDALWSRVRAGWERQVAPEPGQADAFEAASSTADATADRLRRESDRVSQQATAQANLRRSERRLEALAGQEAEVDLREAKARARWQGLWGGLDAPPLSPREMLDWLEDRARVLEKAAEVDAMRRDLDAMEARRDQLREHLRGLLPAAPAATTPPLLSLDRDRAEAELKRLAAVESRRDRLVESSRMLGRQLEAERAKAAAIDGQLAAWRDEWAGAVEPLGLKPDATGEEALDLMARAADLLTGLAAAAQTRERIEAHRRELDRFAADVRETCRRASADLAPDDSASHAAIEAAAHELLRRLREAEEVEAERKAVLKQLAAEHDRLRDAEHASADATRRIESLCREARCRDVAELPEIERRSARAARLREEIRDRDEQIEALRGSETPDAFREAALALDVDRLPERLRELDDRITTLEADRDGWNQILGRQRQILSTMDGSSRAAEAAEAVEELKAGLALDVEEYARLRIASEVLRQSIDRYRQQSQGPVIRRASALFRELTLGSFDSVKVDYDEQDRAVLRAVRAGPGAAVDVEGLSLGTADQLYLALRLASLDAHLEAHEPIPFIVDDILIQFDDDRAAAALGVLAGLSRRTQVILFTHHNRVVDLAEGVAGGEGVVFIHRLHELKAQAGSRAAAAASEAEPCPEPVKVRRGGGRRR
ncbi:AAA family ATPase [Aquisphaera insulae]|uniref:AAA family ATPase n=1 Tax=Aquisphaera insulae TaxID=2712864 RepID=UPI0013EB81F9|nr:AAA family ATPase [Aquisphaera insulae]